MVALVLLKIKIGHTQISVLKIGIPMSKTTPVSTPDIYYIYTLYIYIILCFIYIYIRIFPARGQGIIPPLAKNLLIHPAPGTISSPNKGQFPHFEWSNAFLLKCPPHDKKTHSSKISHSPSTREDFLPLTLNTIWKILVSDISRGFFGIPLTTQQVTSYMLHADGPLID